MKKRWWILIVVGIIVLVFLIMFFYPKKWDFSKNCFGFVAISPFNNDPLLYEPYGCYGVTYGKLIDKSLIDTGDEALDFAKSDKEVINFTQSNDYIYAVMYTKSSKTYDYMNRLVKGAGGEWYVSFCGKNIGDKCIFLHFTPDGNITYRSNPVLARRN